MLQSNRKERGFTLVELAMVIVIIGLIVGGVLAGQDLIKAAQVRAMISQLQGYDAAVNTFQSKFDGLPGDLRRASAFGLGTSGDGDGLISDDGVASLMPAGGVYTFTGEIPWFWAHLSAAKLVAGNYSGTGTGVLGTDFPDSKLKKGGIIVGAGKNLTASNDGGLLSLNFYYIGVAAGVSFGDGMTPVEAFGIDSKLDDGLPDTGVVVAMAANGRIVGEEGELASYGFYANPLGCVKDKAIGYTGPFEYNVSVQNNLCGMRVRISG